VRDFTAGAPGRLRLLPVGAKILYSAFAIATLVGLLLSAKLYSAAIGDAGAAVYYAGATAAAPVASAPATGGPAIEIAPEDAAPRKMVDQMPERKLLEVTHFHLFSIPIYVLVLAHLWLLAKVPPWVQNAGVIAAVVTSGAHIAAPWIVRGHEGLAFLMGGSGVAMLVTLGGIALGAMIDMWLPTPKPPASATSMAEKLAEMRKRKAEQDATSSGS
jgi:hypothetical protein